jgi:hypothetical protein
LGANGRRRPWCPPGLRSQEEAQRESIPATISQNSETVAKVVSAPKFEFVPVGQTSVGIKYKEGKEEVKLAKIRMKFGSRAFTSIKPTGEAW